MSGSGVAAGGGRAGGAATTRSRGSQCAPCTRIVRLHLAVFELHKVLGKHLHVLLPNRLQDSAGQAQEAVVGMRRKAAVGQTASAHSQRLRRSTRLLPLPVLKLPFGRVWDDHRQPLQHTHAKQLAAGRLHRRCRLHAAKAGGVRHGNVSATGAPVTGTAPKPSTAAAACTALPVRGGGGGSCGTGSHRGQPGHQLAQCRVPLTVALRAARCTS